MQTYQAIILGAIQGLTEFLPVSSSAHLNLFPWIFNWDELTECMDVALHIGTLLALIIFFFKDWVRLVVAGYNQVVKKKITKEGKIFWYLVLATIPAGILSLILDKISKAIIGDNINAEMLIIGFTLILMGIILYLVDKKAASKISCDKISLKHAMIIGISQALAAAFPGVSRSGITITVARAMEVDRKSAARFSFLLAMPIILAAVIFDLPHFDVSLELFLGIVTSFVVGLIVIRFLLEYLQKSSYKVFAIYRVVIGILVFLVYLAKVT